MARPAAVLFAALLSSASFASFTSVTSSARAEEPRARQARAPVPLDGIAAIVDDVVLFRSEIDAQARKFEPNLSHDPVQRRIELATLQKDVLTHAIDVVLIGRDAKRLHLEVTDAEVTAGVDSVAQANKLTRQQLDAEVTKLGLTIADYREDVRQQILEQRWLMTRAAGKIDRKAAPDPASFQAALQKQREALLVDLRSHAYIELR